MIGHIAIGVLGELEEEADGEIANERGANEDCVEDAIIFSNSRFVILSDSRQIYLGPISSSLSS